MKTWRSVWILGWLMVACASPQSAYHRQSADSGELTWAYDGGLKLHKNGTEVSDDGWSGLSEVVRCVPEAAELAGTARTRQIVGPILVTTGLVALVGGSAASIVLLADDFDNNLGLSLGLLGGAVVSGLVLGLIGGDQLQGSMTRGVDAVNMYNDEFRSRPECQSMPPTALSAP